MRIFLDTGDPGEVQEVLKYGFELDGVTTNPTLIGKIYGSRAGSYREIVEAFRELGIRDISVETIGCPDYTPQTEDVEEYVKEAGIMDAIDRDIVTVKIPLTPKGVEATGRISGRIMVNNTLCFTLGQAIESARAGALYVSPFIGRLYDIGEDGLALVAAILDCYKKNRFDTDVLTASVRDPQQVADAYEMGSQIVTMPFSVFRQFVEDGRLDELRRMQEAEPEDPDGYRKRFSYADKYETFGHPKLWEGVERFLRDGKEANIRERILASARQAV